MTRTLFEGPGGSGENAAKPIPDPTSWEATGEAQRSEDLEIYDETWEAEIDWKTLKTLGDYRNTILDLRL